ncbi:hypothetical protein D3C81_1617580 [compost metagenome]
MDGRLVAGDHPRALPDTLAIGRNPWRTQVRPVDRRYRHRPALHPGGDGAGAESFRFDFLWCVGHQPVRRGRRVADAPYRRRSRHGVLFQHARRFRGDGQPRRPQWCGTQPCGGGAEFAGVGRGAVRTGSLQVFVGGRCADFPRWQHRLALAGGVVSRWRVGGLDLGAPASTQPLAVRAVAGQCGRQHRLGPAHRLARRR